MSFELNGVQVLVLLAVVATAVLGAASCCALLVAAGMPSSLQNEHARHRHEVQIPANTSAGSHMLLHPNTLTSPGRPELHDAEHIGHVRHLQSLQCSPALLGSQKLSHCSYSESRARPLKQATASSLGFGSASCFSFDSVVCASARQNGQCLHLQ